MKTITLPGSKSITNRDLILASLAEWKSTLRWFLTSDDTVHMVNALKTLSISVQQEDGILFIEWWLSRIRWDGKELFLWNSWTSTRFLTALAALNTHGDIIITGDERMKQRPIKDLVDGVEQLWVVVKTNDGLLPIVIKWWEETQNTLVKMKWNSSSQYFTAILQIAPLLKNGLTIEVIGDLVSKPYIDITLNEMAKFGVEVENDTYKVFKVKPQKYRPIDIDIEWDASALSYFALYNALHGWEIMIDNIGNTSKQWDYKFLDVMKIFGLEYTSDGKITTLKSPGLKNIHLDTHRNFEINFNNMPDVSMSFMVMSIFLPGNTIISWLETLNLKECKRIDAMRDELRKIWVQVESDEKSITIGEYLWNEKLVDIETYNDHRIAMCFGVLNTYIWNLDILNPGCVSKTYPNFWEDLGKITQS